MVSGTWEKLGRVAGLFSGEPRRRIVKLRGGFGTETELMENRALLSASSGLCSVSDTAIVSRIGRAAFTPPDVNNSTWTVSGDATGSAHFTQTKNKVTVQVEALGMTVTAKGRFKASAPNELHGTVRVPNPITGKGKLAVKVNITFENNPTPQTFTGSVSIAKLDLTLNVTGARNV